MLNDVLKSSCVFSTCGARPVCLCSGVFIRRHKAQGPGARVAGSETCLKHQGPDLPREVHEYSYMHETNASVANYYTIHTRVVMP